MLDFMKPEVSALKNVLNGYFAFKSQNSIPGDLLPQQMEEFARSYYAIRLGPPLISVERAIQMQETALGIVCSDSKLSSGPTITLVDIMYGLLFAEGVIRAPDGNALRKVFKKFPEVSREIRGIATYP